MQLLKSEKSFTILFLVIVIIELISSSINSLTDLHYAAKPLILISLIFFFFIKGAHLKRKTKLIMVFALMFSLLGDILLMFVDTSANFFLSGLIAFLLAHIMYINVFIAKRENEKPSLIILVFLLLYALGLFYLLKDGLGDMTVPVIVYMVTILSMAMVAWLRRHSVSKLSHKLVFIGALFFIISDSVIALDKFYQSVPFSRIIIMSTYALAQYLIVLGILKQSKSYIG